MSAFVNDEDSLEGDDFDFLAADILEAEESRLLHRLIGYYANRKKELALLTKLIQLRSQASHLCAKNSSCNSNSVHTSEVVSSAAALPIQLMYHERKGFGRARARVCDVVTEQGLFSDVSDIPPTSHIIVGDVLEALTSTGVIHVRDVEQEQGLFSDVSNITPTSHIIVESSGGVTSSPVSLEHTHSTVSFNNIASHTCVILNNLIKNRIVVFSQLCQLSFNSYTTHWCPSEDSVFSQLLIKNFDLYSAEPYLIFSSFATQLWSAEFNKACI